MNEEKELNMEILNKELGGFSGTTGYTKDTLGILLTDGTKYLMDRAKCGWLMSDIAVIVKTKLNGQEFIVITIKVEDCKAEVIYDDGNENVLYTQHYEYTDFPAGKLKLYFSNNVLLLPGEY